MESGPHVIQEVVKDFDTAKEVLNELKCEPDGQAHSVCQVLVDVTARKPQNSPSVTARLRKVS